MSIGNSCLNYNVVRRKREKKTIRSSLTKDKLQAEGRFSSLDSHKGHTLIIPFALVHKLHLHTSKFMDDLAVEHCKYLIIWALSEI